MTVRTLSPSTWLATSGPRRPKVLAVGSWLLVGDVFDRRRHFASDEPVLEDAHLFERKMIRRFWGRYVGVRLGPDGDLVAVLRDPSGALECLTWSAGGLLFAASDAPAWLVAAVRPDWRLALDRIASALADPLNSWGACLIDGPNLLTPGVLADLTTGETTVLWQPDVFARWSEDGIIGDVDAETCLRDAVDEAVGGLARNDGGLAAEISGGLDSAIVAGSLARVRPDVALWLNAYGIDPGSDERSYARAMASLVGARLTEVPRAPEPLTEAMLLGLTVGVRPGFNALDTPNDRVWADHLQQAGATTLMTGKGGDAVFIQGAGSDVFSDLWRERGASAILSPALPALARWNGRSVWSLVADARAHDRRRARLGQRPSFITGLLVGEPDPTGNHPWLEAADDLGPAKRYQIAGVINGATFHGASAQTAAADLVHPLLAQPVVETCLVLSARQLTQGQRDRALARAAFRDRLPRSIAERRSKGELTAYYGRRLARSLGVVRPWLLEGRLAAAGLVDRPKLDGLLREDSLIWRGGVGEIMIAAAMESWVRTWEARLAPRM